MATSGRKCGDCTVCCHVYAVAEIAKPAHVDCPHLRAGCSLFDQDQRPELCSRFQCAWLRGCGLPSDRPDLNGVVCTFGAMNGGQWCFVIELSKDASTTTGLAMVERLASIASFPVIIVDHDARPPDDKGDRVVVRNDLKRRAAKICGQSLGFIDDKGQLGMYELVVG